MNSLPRLVGENPNEVSVDISNPSSFSNKSLLVLDENTANGRDIKKMSLEEPSFFNVYGHGFYGPNTAGDCGVVFKQTNNDPASVKIFADDGGSIDIGDSSGDINITSNGTIMIGDPTGATENLYESAQNIAIGGYDISIGSGKGSGETKLILSRDIEDDTSTITLQCKNELDITSKTDKISLTANDSTFEISSSTLKFKNIDLFKSLYLICYFMDESTAYDDDILARGFTFSYSSNNKWHATAGYRFVSTVNDFHEGLFEDGKIIATQDRISTLYEFINLTPVVLASHGTTSNKLFSFLAIRTK